jgi:molecular chaperone GrpE
MEENLEKETEVIEEVEDKKLSKKQVKKYEKEIEDLNKQVFDWQQKYALALNTAAHHENLMKHYKQEYENFAKYRSQAMIEKIIPALDSFQMAFSLPATTKETENYRIGFEFILRQLKDALENEGVIEIAPVVGNKFDHNVHSAVESVETEDEKLVGTIQSVRLNGYKLKDRLIRPATVVVYVLKVVKEEVKEENEDVKDEVIEETKVEDVKVDEIVNDTNETQEEINEEKGEN